MLTIRELDVLGLLAEGCSYAAIGERLGISAHAVASHVKNAYRKLDVHCAAAAVIRALQMTLLLVEPRLDQGDAGERVGGDVHRDRVVRRL
jgi:DNA-binding NarL/FixJ family response regulator